MDSSQYTPPLPAGIARLDPSRVVPRSVLAIRPGALGDALLVWPALAWLRSLGASTTLHLVSRADVLPLALHAGIATGASAYDDPRWLGLFAPTLPLPLEATAADVVIAWLDDPHGEIGDHLRTACHGRVIVCPGHPDPGRGEHAALQLLRPLAALGLALPRELSPTGLRALLPPLDPGADATANTSRWWSAHGLGEQPTRPVVALHPGSGGAAKRWPAERFGILATDIARRGACPLLLAGPQDAEVADRVRAVARANGLAGRDLPQTGMLSIIELAALLRRCALLVGNDAGVSHLGALVGIPVLALFGPSDPVLWEPLGAEVLRAPDGDLSRLDVATVRDALVGLLPQR